MGLSVGIPGARGWIFVRGFGNTIPALRALELNGFPPPPPGISRDAAFAPMLRREMSGHGSEGHRFLSPIPIRRELIYDPTLASGTQEPPGPVSSWAELGSMMEPGRATAGPGSPGHFSCVLRFGRMAFWSLTPPTDLSYSRKRNVFPTKINEGIILHFMMLLRFAR